MAFETFKVNTLDIKKNKDVAQEGYFTGREDITTKIGPQIIWKFQDKQGNPFGIYGFTNLNFKMKGAPTGYLMRITYKGTEKRQTKFGMKDVHQVLVEIDRSDVLTAHDENEADPAEESPF